MSAGRAAVPPGDAHTGSVSVVVPTHNYGRFLPACVDSILCQTTSPLEVVVVDDGSTDDSSEVIRRYGDRVTYLRQERMGPAAARNRGIRATRGDYIAFVDADDVLRPDSLERRSALLDRHADIGLVFADVRVFGEPRVPLPFALLATKRHFLRLPKRQLGDDACLLEGNVFGALIRDRFIAMPTVMVRRACLRQVGLFDERLRAQEDWDLWVRMIEETRVACIERVLADCRQHEDNISTDRLLIAATHVEFVRRLLAKGAPATHSHRLLLRRRLSLYLSELGYLRFSMNATDKARECFLQAALCWPFDRRLLVYGAASLLPVAAIESMRRWKRRVRRIGLRHEEGAVIDGRP